MNDALKIIGDKRRQRILQLVWDAERPAGDIAKEIPEISFGAVSQHLKVLRDAGLLDMRKDGRSRYYRAKPEALGPLAQYLTTMWRNRLSALKAAAEAAEREKEN